MKGKSSGEMKPFNQTTTMIKNRRILLAGLTIIAVLPALFLLALIIKYSVNVPFCDGIACNAPFLCKKALGTLTFLDFFGLNAGVHRPFVNWLVIFLMTEVTEWNVRYQMYLSFTLACITSFNIYYLCRATIKTKTFHMLLMFFTNLLIFGTIQEFNWLWGFHIVIFVPAACISTGMAICYTSLPIPWKTFITIILSIISSVSFGNGIFCWILLFPSLFISIKNNKNWRVCIAIYLTSMVVTLMVYFNNFPVKTYELTKAAVFILIKYYFNLLGAPLFTVPGEANAVLPGVLLFVLFLYCFVYCCFKVKKSKSIGWEQLVPWFTFAAYSIMTALLITYGRGCPVEKTKIEYVTMIVYLPISLIFIGTIVYHDFVRCHMNRLIHARVLISLLLLITAAGHIYTSIYGLYLMEARKQHRLGDRALMSLMNLFPGQYNLGCVLIPAIPVLYDAGYWGLPIVNSRDISKIKGESLYPPGQYGNFDQIEKFNEVIYRASGNAFLPHRNNTAHAVFLSYMDSGGAPILFEYIVGPFPRSNDRVRFSDIETPFSDHWEITFSILSLPDPGAEISAWAYDAISGKAYLLNNNIRLPI